MFNGDSCKIRFFNFNIKLFIHADKYYNEIKIIRWKIGQKYRFVVNLKQSQDSCNVFILIKNSFYVHLCRTRAKPKQNWIFKKFIHSSKTNVTISFDASNKCKNVHIKFSTWLSDVTAYKTKRKFTSFAKRASFLFK